MNELKFTKTHEWIRSDEALLTIGITDHAQQLLGDLVFIDLPETGREVSAGDELGVLESVKAASDFYAPISGTVLEVNHDVSANPALVNTDPEDAGWLVKIKAHDTEELKGLLDAAEYNSLIAEEH